jgi:hypothetical protein
MTGSSRVRAIIRVAVTLALVLSGGWRSSAAQVIQPKFKELTLGELADLETFKKLGDGLKKIKNTEDLTDKHDTYYKDLEKLSPDDDQYEPDYKLPGTPELPSLCKNSGECEACFKQPYAELQNTRFRFEKLRRLNKVTKDMLRDAISFGDAAASAAGGLAGLAWNKEKIGIRASEAGFNQSYDAKYEELLATLKSNLMDIAACEAEVFGNEAWYDRFGFIYQQFMATAYRRPD